MENKKKINVSGDSDTKSVKVYKTQHSTIQIGRQYAQLLKRVCDAQVPRTSIRRTVEVWIIEEAKKAGLL